MHPARDLGTKSVSSLNLMASAAKASPQEIDSVQVPSAEISVTTRQLENRLIVYEITAAVGEHSETQRFSIGDGGSSPKQASPMTAEELQVWLDDKRQTMADNVAWHATMEDSAAQVE